MKRVLSMVVLSVLFFALFADELGATERRCIQQTRYWGGDGTAQHLVVIDGHALFGGFTLRVADLADPTDPEVVHEVRLENSPTDLASNGQRVYVVDGGNEVTVIDAAVPDQARIEGSFAPEDSYWNLYQVDVHGDLGVVGGRGEWAIPMTTSILTFFDASGSAAGPVILGAIQIDGIVESLALGDHAAVAVTRSNRILFIDVGDPTIPTVAADLNASDWLVSGEIRYLEASEDLLAISDSEGRLTLVDISEADEPAYLSLIQNLDIGIVTVDFEGPTIHAVGSICTQFGVCGGYALINALAPRSPVVVGRTDGPLMASPAPHAGHVVAAAFKAGMRVVDLRGLANPAVLDVVLPVRDVGAIASADRLAHVVDLTTLADPEEPVRNTLKVLRRLADGGLAQTASYGPEGAIWALAAEGDYVAAAIYDEAIEFHSVEVIDVSDPAAPVSGTRLGAEVSWDEETYAAHLAIEDGYLYFSLEDSDQILIHRLAEGGRVTQVGQYSPDEEMLNFAVSSRDLLVVAVRDDETGWVEIVDTRVPSSSVVASVVDLPDPMDVPVSVEAEGDRVVILGRDFDGFNGPYNASFLFDVTDPSNPTLAMDGLPGGMWIALGAGVYHTITDTHPPSGSRHTAMTVTDPPDAGAADDLGHLEIFRDRVDADGSYFCLSRHRLEVHRYGPCTPLAATTRPPSFTE